MEENQEELELLMQGKLMKRMQDCVFSSLRSKYDLKQVEIEVMICLYACPEQTAAEIAKKLCLQKGHVSLALDRLREKRLIACRRDTEDRRMTLISLTEEGYELFRKIQLCRQTMNEIMFRGFSEEESAELNRLSKRIIENIRSETGSAVRDEDRQEIHA